MNCTIRVPPEMCSPYTADFDGDEMRLLPVLSSKGIDECKAYRLNYQRISDKPVMNGMRPARCNPIGTEFNDMCLRSTVFWPDSKSRGFKVTNTHILCQLSICSFCSFSKADRECRVVRQ